MTASWMARSLAVALFAVCAGLIALPGCGKPAATQPEKKDDKKDDAKSTLTPNPGGKTPDTPAPPPKTTLGEVEPAAEQAANKFRSDLGMNDAKADSLSAAFVRVVGKPRLPSDKEKGFSPEEAASWLRKVGDRDTVAVNPSLYQKQAGDVVYIRGLISGARVGKEPGSYSLRLVKEGGAWKVDWLSLTSADLEFSSPAITPEGVAQEFAVVAFVETIADSKCMPEDVRTPLVAAAMSPALRMAWGPPTFDDDKPLGYNAKKIHIAATNVGGGTSKFTVARVGDLPEYTVTLTKPAGKKTYTVRLMKGTGPNEWLVNEVIEQKG
jgi:hypothetical protein